MKSISIFIIILLLATPTVSAGSWNPIEIGENMISDGISGALRKFADEIMNTICGTPGDDDDAGHGSVTSMIIRFATWGVKPFEYATILRVLGMSFALGIGLLVTYFFIGAGKGAINNTIGDYAKNSVYGILLMSFAPLLVWIALLFASVVKIMMMESIADSISPSIVDSVILYLMMALMWLLVAIFFGISNIVICLTAGLSMLLGGLYAFEKTRHVALWAIDYFVTMIVMQIMVIVIAVVVVGFIGDIKRGTFGALISPGMELISYTGMILLILIMCIFMTFGKALVLKTAKKALLLVI